MAIKRDVADKWFSDVVRLNKQSTCQKCGKQGRTECAHIFGRRAKSVRWSMDNAVCLCHYCHKYFTANPTQFTDWLIGCFHDGEWVDGYLGQAHMDILREKWQVLMPTNKLLRAEIAKHYRDEHKKMQLDELYTPVSYN